ncbi:MAG: hypothetical protein M3066_12820 [Actinomycetota bacterium]|nr:hypothetical protein [Actinomycetota bacterium]
MADDQTGLLIIRAWVEEGSAEPLRAHIRLSTDISSGVERTFTLTRTDSVRAAVGEWLGDMLGGTVRTGPADPP